MWAGKGWGSVSTPRIGQEVIVDFLEGDPDQPIIIGSVHNAENMPPHTRCRQRAQVATRTRARASTQMTMDDTAGKEKITIHGQYDMDTTVEHDQTNTVNNDFTETIKKNATISITEGNLQSRRRRRHRRVSRPGRADRDYDDTQKTTVKNAITIMSHGGPIAIASDAQHIYMKAATSIQLECGASTIWMDSGGQIRSRASRHDQRRVEGHDQGRHRAFGGRRGSTRPRARSCSRRQAARTRSRAAW